MAVVELLPNPPKQFASLVNVLELNRLLRELDVRLSKLEATGEPTAGISTSSSGTATLTNATFTNTAAFPIVADTHTTANVLLRIECEREGERESWAAVVNISAVKVNGSTNIAVGSAGPAPSFSAGIGPTVVLGGIAGDTTVALRVRYTTGLPGTAAPAITARWNAWS